ncbi:hypothetical protein BH23CHL5_BH23CHL5_19670 [soil metagenome]
MTHPQTYSVADKIGCTAAFLADADRAVRAAFVAATLLGSGTAIKTTDGTGATDVRVTLPSAGSGWAAEGLVVAAILAWLVATSIGRAIFWGAADALTALDLARRTEWNRSRHGRWWGIKTRSGDGASGGIAENCAANSCGTTETE